MARVRQNSWRVDWESGDPHALNLFLRNPEHPQRAAAWSYETCTGARGYTLHRSGGFAQWLLDQGPDLFRLDSQSIRDVAVLRAVDIGRVQ